MAAARDARSGNDGYGLILAVSDLDILRSASMHLKLHGDQEVAHACEMVRAMKERSGNEGAEARLRIIVAIETIPRGPSGTLQR